MNILKNISYFYIEISQNKIWNISRTIDFFFMTLSLNMQNNVAFTCKMLGERE